MDSVNGLGFDSIDFSVDFSRQFPPDGMGDNEVNGVQVRNDNEVFNGMEFRNENEVMVNDIEDVDANEGCDVEASEAVEGNNNLFGYNLDSDSNDSDFQVDEEMLADDEDSPNEDDEDSSNEDEEDSDFNIDLENEVEDVDVDMRDFNAHVDSEVEYVGNNHTKSIGMNYGLEDDDILAADCLSYESFDSRTDSSMSDFETRRSRKLREVRNKEKVNNFLLFCYYCVSFVCLFFSNQAIEFAG